MTSYSQMENDEDAEEEPYVPSRGSRPGAQRCIRVHALSYIAGPIYS